VAGVDIAVVGLGLVGSSALYQLAKRGFNVVGFDQFDPPHTLGSSTGDTRITRLAIGEGHFYTPFVMRSHQIWRELEATTGLELLNSIGGLMMASRSYGSELHGSVNFFDETVSAAKKYDIAYEILGADEIRRRYPQFNLVGDEIGYFEPTAGFIRPENCIRANLLMAKKFGAQVVVNERIASISVDPKDKNYVGIRGENSGFWGVKKVIVSAGAWVTKFLPDDCKNKFQVQRQVQYWFKSTPAFYESFLPDRFPIFIWQNNGGFSYGFPAIDGLDGGVKIATEKTEQTTPGSIRRYVTSDEFEDMYGNFVKDRLRGFTPNCVKTAVCMYTKTPDSHFVVDLHPEYPQIIIASPCSGHGAKHSGGIGEALAELATEGKTRYDISHFGLNRFKD